MLLFLLGARLPQVSTQDPRGLPFNWPGALAPGPHRVGFARWIEEDAARPWQMKFADGTRYADEPAPRPVLVELWYPAVAARGDSALDGEAVLRGDYLELGDELAHGEARLERFCAALSRYARATAIPQLLDRDEAQLGAGERARLDAWLAAPTTAFLDADPAPGRHPLVLWHSGYGSSHEDNAAMCEWLASEGFVVAASAYPTGDGSSFNIDAHEDSARDLELLARRLASRPEVDATRIAIAGHSGGGHTTVRMALRQPAIAQAYVVLDTTQDYHSLADPRWGDWPPAAVAARERLTAPMLFAAAPAAWFTVGDALDRCERWYVTVDLDHNEFIEQGVACAQLTKSANAAAIAARHAALCERVRDFLRATLQGDAAARARLDAAGADRAALAACEHVAVGMGVPPPPPIDSDAVPTPRQLRPLLARDGAAAVAARLAGWRAREPLAPLFRFWVGYSLLFELHASGRADDLRVLAPAFAKEVPDVVAVLKSQGDFMEKRGDAAYAKRCREIVALAGAPAAGR